MAVGPEPNQVGQLTVTAPCASCSGQGVQVDPGNYQNYAQSSESSQDQGGGQTAVSMPAP